MGRGLSHVSAFSPSWYWICYTESKMLPMSLIHCLTLCILFFSFVLPLVLQPTVRQMCSSFLDINRGSSQTQVVPLFPFNSQKMPFTYLLLIWIAKSARENSLFWNIKFNCKSKKQKKKGGMVSVCVASLPFLSQGSPLGQRELQLSFQWTQRFQTGSDFFFFFFLHIVRS